MLNVLYIFENNFIITSSEDVNLSKLFRGINIMPVVFWIQSR